MALQAAKKSGPVRARLQDERFAPLTPAIVAELGAIVGTEFVLQAQDVLQEYAHDWTEDLCYLPEVVVKPTSTAQVAALLQCCNQHRLPVVAVGARTGLSGGMLPVYGGVVLAMERMNRIVALDERNLQITVEAGVITEQVQEAAAAVGLMYPPDPSSKGSCFIGGNLAENAGGLHAVKYGITNAYVLALEAVLPTGQVIHTGARVLKNSTGYNLTQLLVGSEGTLAVITQATLRLLPLPSQRLLMLAPFADAAQACNAVSAIFQAKLTPAALEFLEKDAILFGQAFLGINRYSTQGVEGHLLVEFDGNEPEQLMQDAERCLAVLERFGALEVLLAQGAEQQQELWRLRRCLGEAVKGTTFYKEEDTVVPRAELANLLHYVKQLGREYGFKSVCYGHAGDGNLHINILKGELSDAFWENELPKAIRKLFEYTVQLGGTLSGEHGIGYVQRRYMDVKFTEVELQLMRGIKQVFDPHGILNPGKIF